jgi:outer membrane protease
MTDWEAARSGRNWGDWSSHWQTSLLEYHFQLFILIDLIVCIPYILRYGELNHLIGHIVGIQKNKLRKRGI